MAEARRLVPEATPSAFSGMRAGSALSKAGTDHRRDFMVLRRQNHEPVRLSLPHVPIFKMLWKIWLKKKLDGDPLATNAYELTDAMDIAYSTVRAALESMARNGMVREHSTLMGRYRASYGYEPTQTGIELLALAEYLGDGALVQIGRKSSAWKSPSSSEPKNLFEHARLLNGGDQDER